MKKYVILTELLGVHHIPFQHLKGSQQLETMSISYLKPTG